MQPVVDRSIWIIRVWREASKTISGRWLSIKRLRTSRAEKGMTDSPTMASTRTDVTCACWLICCAYCMYVASQSVLSGYRGIVRDLRRTPSMISNSYPAFDEDVLGVVSRLLQNIENIGAEQMRDNGVQLFCLFLPQT